MTGSRDLVDVHALAHDDFLDTVHSFEFWFQAVEGYLAGTTYGHAEGLVDEPPTGADRERLVDVLCNYCVGEAAALEASSGLIGIAPNRQAKIFLSTQVVDEGRHLEVLLHRLRDLGVAEPEAEVDKRGARSLVLFKRRLLDVVASKDWEGALFTQNVILESLEFAVFRHHARDADPVTAEILRGIIKDERRHIGFGENELGRRLTTAPHTRARLQQTKRELDHLVLDALEETARHIGVDAAERAEIGRAYLESTQRLGFVA